MIRIFSTFFLFFLICSATPVNAQMFYNARSGFDSTGATTHSAQTNAAHTNKERSDDEDAERGYRKIVAKEIIERIRADAAYIIGEPEETLCYGVARKSPKRRSATLDGFEHTGNCGSLNDMGLAEVQSKLFNAASYEMSVTKIVSCVTSPKLVLRFRRGFDFVDTILSGGSCPAVIFMYGGDTKEFSAKPIKDWLNNFIEAVSKDLEPVDKQSMENAAADMFKKRSPEEIAAEEEAHEKQASEPVAPKAWGRRPRPAPVEEENATAAPL